MTSNPLIKFPQILGAALSANVFVIIASALPKGEWPEFEHIALLLTIFALNLKDGIDDFKSYESSYQDGFSLAPTVTFRVLSYMALAGAAVQSSDWNFGFYFVSFYFVIFLIWSTNSIIRRSKRSVRGEANDERLRRRWGWLVLYSVSAACALGIAIVESDIFDACAFGMLLAMYIVDCIDCETFSNEINPTL